jgi:DNA-binding MarR family transcriptional regulator
MLYNTATPGYGSSTMIAQPIDFEVGYKELERAAAGVIDGGHREAALLWLKELGQHVEQVVGGADLAAVARWSARLDRLAANLPDGEQRDMADGYLRAMMHALDRRAAALAQQRDVKDRDAIAGGVRERVLALVAEEPRVRSGDIAERLGIVPSQASRALRELQERGEVFLAEPSSADHDKRVHRYIAASAAHAAQAA